MFLLGGSRLRKKIMAYIFAHPGESYHVRGLAAHISADPGNLSRALNALLQEGLFLSSRKGNLKLYTINQNYPLYAELKTIVSKTEGLESGLRELLQKFNSINLAFVYGSYAKKRENGLSDIDLVVVEKIHDLEKKFDREINYTSYTEYEFANERKKKGGFLNLVLEDKILLLKGNLHD